jgi:hypothetical protein
MVGSQGLPLFVVAILQGAQTLPESLDATVQCVVGCIRALCSELPLNEGKCMLQRRYPLALREIV